MTGPTVLARLVRDVSPSFAIDLLDTELLRRYAADRDEAAFAELVRRNGPIVLRTCRHVLGEAHADDAFQAVFLLLARSADRLTRAGSLAGWLHAAAVRVAHRARRGEERRRKREVKRRTPPATADRTWAEVREVLDTEIAALPEQYRLPLVLCYLQEMTQDEAARRVGCEVGVLRGRLDRGRARLRRRLARCGLPLAAPVLVLGSPPPVSAALVGRTVGVVMTTARSVGRSALAPLTGWGALVLTPIVVAAAFVLATAGGPPVPDQTPPGLPPVVRAAPEPVADALGDPLPPGAVARLGSARFHHGDNVSRVIVGADTKLVASEAGYQAYKLWDAVTGQPVPLWAGLIKVPPAQVHFTITSGGERLAALVRDPNGSTLRDPVSGALIRTFPPLGPMDLADLAPDGKTLVAVQRRFVGGRMESALRVWPAGAERWTELEHSPGELSARPFLFSADSKRVAVCPSDGTVRVWDVVAAKELCRLPATAQDLLEGVAFSPDGKLIAREDRPAKKVRVWDVDTEKERPDLPDQPKAFGQALAFSADSRTLAGIVQPVTIRLWDVAAGKKLRDIRGHDFQMRHLAFARDGTRLYAADGSSVSVWDPETGKPLDDTGSHRYSIADAAWSPNGKRVASGAAYTDNVARVWDAATGRKVFDLVGHKYGIERIAYSPDGTLLATGSQDATVKLWDAATGKNLHTFAPNDGMVYAMAFSPDGRFLVSGGRKAIHVLDVAARIEARSIPYAGGLVLELTFLKGGARLMVGDQGGGARVLDFATGNEVSRPAAKWSWAVAFSPAGGVATMSGGDGTVRLIDADTGRELRVLAAAITDHPDDRAVLGVRFAPDGRTVAVSYRNGDIRVYEVATGSERFRFAGHAGAPTGLRFSPDGSRLCSFSGDRTLLVWDVTGDRLPPAPAPKGIDAAWVDLESTDARKGFAAIRHLSGDPTAALRLVSAGVKPVTVPDAKAVAALIGRLDSDDFAEREAATKELAALAPSAVEQLRVALGKSDSPEVRARLGKLVTGVSGMRLTGERLRAVRAVELLERLGTAEARKLLADLAAGAPGATLTQDAEASLGRTKTTK